MAHLEKSIFMLSGGVFDQGWSYIAKDKDVREQCEMYRIGIAAPGTPAGVPLPPAALIHPCTSLMYWRVHSSSSVISAYPETKISDF